MKRLGIVVALIFGAGVSSVYANSISSQDILGALSDTYMQKAKQIEEATIPEGGFDFSPNYNKVQSQFRTSVDQFACTLGVALARALGKSSVEEVRPEDIPNPNGDDEQKRKWRDLVDRLWKNRDVARDGATLLGQAGRIAQKKPAYL
jgi:hypothetical protein